MSIEQSEDEYIEFLHRTSVLTRAQLGDCVESFDVGVPASRAAGSIGCATRWLVRCTAWLHR
jgi:hypothetical protein